MGTEERKISSLRDLPRDIAPPRDLWKGIEAQLAAEPRGSIGHESDAAGGRATVDTGRVGRWGRTRRLQIIALAAMLATLAVGIWIGRAVMPSAGKPAGTGTGLSASVPTAGQPEALRAAYMLDSRYTAQRAALVQSLEAKLDALPPESRTKVLSSLQTIQDSVRDLQAALGRDPTNALLQELLVNTYQDEMRVLTAVHEAGENGKGI
jgi:hypothetical protein